MRVDGRGAGARLVAARLVAARLVAARLVAAPCVLFAACDTIYAEPVWRVDDAEAGAPDASAGDGALADVTMVDGDVGVIAEGGAVFDGGLGADASLPSSTGELCDPCTSGSDCGDSDDYCLVYEGNPDTYCGRDCLEDNGCPAGYECVPLQNAPDIEQCIPSDRTCDADDAGTEPSPEEMSAYLLQRIEAIRSAADAPSYGATMCLNTLATDSVVEMVSSGTFLTKYRRECEPIIPDCSCDWREENQAVVGLLGRTWQEAIDLPLDESTAGGTEDPFYANLVSTEWTRIGVAVRIDDAVLRFSTTFGP